MSFNGAYFLQSSNDKAFMAKWEIHKRFGFIEAFWWKAMPGTVISTRWPVGWTEPVPAPGGGFIQSESADPNDHYRPWLEKNVGKQGWDWNWRIGTVAADNGAGTRGYDSLCIKFRMGKERYATIAALRWN